MQNVNVQQQTTQQFFTGEPLTDGQITKYMKMLVGQIKSPVSIWNSTKPGRENERLLTADLKNKGQAIIKGYGGTVSEFAADFAENLSNSGNYPTIQVKHRNETLNARFIKAKLETGQLIFAIGETIDFNPASIQVGVMKMTPKNHDEIDMDNVSSQSSDNNDIEISM